jgi:hypothetical protein
MDWLRSEDLKEEKNVTAPTTVIAYMALRRCQTVAKRNEQITASFRTVPRACSLPNSDSNLRELIPEDGSRTTLRNPQLYHLGRRLKLLCKTGN